jgi:hypothetical protein
MHIAARVISIALHPLLMLTYMLVMLLLVNPYSFGVHSIADQQARVLLARVFLSSFFIPAIAVLMLHFTGLLRSLEMPDKEDRIGPYIITGVFYLWLFRNFLDNSQIPAVFVSFTLGATIALFLAFFINIFSKISIHALGMGGLVGVTVLIMAVFPGYGFLSMDGGRQIDIRIVLITGILLSGITGTARLYLRAHEPIDLWGGYLIGFAAQFIAARFILT